MPTKNHAGNWRARMLRVLRTVDEKLDDAIIGHGKRIRQLEHTSVDHETRIDKLERAYRRVARKMGDV